MKRLLFIMSVAVLLLPLRVAAQVDSVVSMSDNLSLLSSAKPKPSDTLRKWEYHLSMGSEIVGGRYGSASLFGITPSVIYRPNERLKIRTSVSLLNSYSLMPQGYVLRGREQRSMAPLRNPAGRAAALSVDAAYKINDRLTLSASLLHLGGDLASGMIVNPWLMGSGPVMLDATAFSASMRYRIGKDSYLDVHMTMIDDRTGAFWPALMEPYCSPFHPFSTINPLFQ